MFLNYVTDLEQNENATSESQNTINNTSYNI